MQTNKELIDRLTEQEAKRRGIPTVDQTQSAQSGRSDSQDSAQSYTFDELIQAVLEQGNARSDSASGSSVRLDVATVQTIVSQKFPSSGHGDLIEADAIAIKRLALRATMAQTMAHNGKHPA
ncbi:MAG: hypothetical protein Kow00121_60580 [Elainellaceae cyanobacterium]